MKLAVTGGSGFVGRHVLSLAAAQRLEVAALVRSDEAARVVAGAGALPVRGGLEPDALGRAMAGASVVIHLAQIGSEKPGATFDAINVEGTRAVIAAARAAGVRRVVYLSGLGVARYGLSPRSTNRYFLSKLAGEGALLQSGLEIALLRPSYIVGPGDGLLRRLLREMAAGTVCMPGDGSYRMQPVAVGDAAAAILAATGAGPGFDARPPHRGWDLVGPEPVSYASLVERVGAAARAAGRPARFTCRAIDLAEAERMAGGPGGFHGLDGEDLDCLLCDEVGDARPLEALLGRFLTPVDEAVAIGVRGTRT